MKRLLILAIAIVMMLSFSAPAMATPAATLELELATQTCIDQGWFRGYSDGLMNWPRTMTRAELAIVAERTGCIPYADEKGNATLEDVERYMPWVATRAASWEWHLPYVSRLQVALLMYRTYAVREWFGITLPADE